MKGVGLSDARQLLVHTARTARRQPRDHAPRVERAKGALCLLDTSLALAREILLLSHLSPPRHEMRDAIAVYSLQCVVTLSRTPTVRQMRAKKLGFL